MNPDRYCLDEAAPPGSSLHYATLFVSARERAAFVAIHALKHTLLGIDAIADPNVRAHKLNWWSNEIMEARDGRARHPVAIAITRRGAPWFWRRPEVIAMISAIGRASAANGFRSEAARNRFCEDIGGGTARLCAAGLAADAGPLDGISALGTALECAVLAGAPSGWPCLAPIPDTAPNSSGRAGRGRGPNTASQRLAEERTRARETLAEAVHDIPRRAGPAALVYRTLAQIQLAALMNALRKPPWTAPSSVSITPIRKLWIAWRTALRAG